MSLTVLKLSILHVTNIGEDDAAHIKAKNRLIISQNVWLLGMINYHPALFDYLIRKGENIVHEIQLVSLGKNKMQ